MTRTILEAEQHIKDQSLHGPAFGINECQMQCRIAYDIPSDGTPTASSGWARSKDRHPSTDPRATPRGAFNHWVGGSSGAGHVTVSRFEGGADWSTDFGRVGYWNDCDPRDISVTWSSLHFVGWSWDIDGVSVKPASAPKPANHPHVDAAIAATKIALKKRKNDTARHQHLATALRELYRALGGKK